MRVGFLVDQFSLTHRLLMGTLNGLTEEDWLFAPESGGNSINWLVGHLLVSRYQVLQSLGVEGRFDENRLEPYMRGSSGTERDTFLNSEELINLFNEAHELYLSRMNELADADLASEVTNPAFNIQQPIEELLVTYYFHESYHLGQVGYVRRLTGKDGIVK